MQRLLAFLILTVGLTLPLSAQVDNRPRILISTDIGGTDPDDNQSFAHLLMFSEMFRMEGLVSSPSYGEGSTSEMHRMIDLYAKDLPELSRHVSGLATPEFLHSICKQGKHGSQPYAGYSKPTEGSNWIITCARKESDSPLYILVWGCLDDVAQALHDAPDILPNIRVYWIGGPNKKWGVYSYNYIAKKFPDIWMIEDNAAYFGFIAQKKKKDVFNAGYYDTFIKGCGNMGDDFIKYYKGLPKMGDTPSLLYMMNGNPADPEGESWGGSFEKITYSPLTVFNRNLTSADTVAVYSLVEMRFKGPRIKVPADSVCFTVTIDKQTWAGYYLDKGIYSVIYSPKRPEKLDYVTSSKIPALNDIKGEFVVSGQWPGKKTATSIPLGANWYSDRQDKALFMDKWQGAQTVLKYREKVLAEWAKRWAWLKFEK